MYIQDFFATFYQLVSLSILFLKCCFVFFKVPSFLSNIFNCIKTCITRDSRRYKVCSTFKDILDIIWLLFYVVGNITHWKILFKSWIPGFEMEQLLLGRTSGNCVWSMWSCVFGFMVLKVFNFCICSKVEVFCVSVSYSLKLDFPLVQFLHTFARV